MRRFEALTRIFEALTWRFEALTRRYEAQRYWQQSVKLCKNAQACHFFLHNFYFAILLYWWSHIFFVKVGGSLTHFLSCYFSFFVLTSIQFGVAPLI